ncbi:MAG: HNH endonuclease, partial [Actinomycetota bacterium]|nr:HNH endonuclease [Actinomycetota bacterium]
IAPHEAKRLVRTATALRRDLPAVAAAMGSGAVSLAQAEVIVQAIADLPAETPVACRPQAEATMIGYAGSFDPVLLARIGRRLAEIIDPDGVQARDEKPILDKETDAHRDRTLTLSPDTDGAGGYLRARLDAQGYATLAAYLSAATAPGLTPDGSTVPPAVGDGRHLGQCRHDALVEAARQMLTGGGLPSSGGIKPRIVLTLPAACLTNRTGTARLPDGVQLSPSLTRLISCDADLVPVTVDTTGNPLDVGRTRRLFTGPLRTALEVRDRGCAWPGCDRPISWTQAHHILSWLNGGKTALDNGVLLCLFHHHEIERGDWTVTIRQGRAWFRPPTWIDPDRTPRINPMHHPPPRE